MEYCSIRTCKNFNKPNSKIDLYPLPSSTHERFLWVKAFGLKEISPYTRICGAHFKTKYFLHRKSDAGEITSQNLFPAVNPSFTPNLRETVFSNSTEEAAASTSTVLSESPILDTVTFETGNVPNARIVRVSDSLLPEMGNCNSTRNSEVIPVKLQSKDIIPEDLELVLECQDDFLSPAQEKAHAEKLMSFMSASEAILRHPKNSVVYATSSETSIASGDLVSQQGPVLNSLGCIPHDISLSPRNISSTLSDKVPEHVSCAISNSSLSSLRPSEMLLPEVLEKSEECLPVEIEDLASDTSQGNFPEIIETDEKLEIEGLSKDVSERSGDTGNNFLSGSSSKIPDKVDDIGEGPVIIDVICAKQGASEYFCTDKIPETILSKLSQKTKEDDNSKTQSNGTSVSPKVESLSTVLHLQKLIPYIPSGEKTLSIRNLLNIRPCSQLNISGKALRMRLRQEGFITCSVWWLIEKGYLPLNPPCSICGGKSFSIYRNKRFFDGYCWICDNSECMTKDAVKRPKFFERFIYFTLEELLLLTYHWACQSTLEEILIDVNLDLEKIWSYFQAIRKLCGDVVESKCSLGGSGPENKVEISVIRIGNFYILGAYDRMNHHTRMEALTLYEACESSRHIDLIKKWLYKYSVLISDCEIKENLPDISTVAADPAIKYIRSSQDHILNVSQYLARNMVSLFGNYCHDQLDKNLIQGFLDELQWRDRFGQSAEMAFWSILNQINDLNNHPFESVEVRPGIITAKDFIDNGNEHLKERWGPIIGEKKGDEFLKKPSFSKVIFEKCIKSEKCDSEKLTSCDLEDTSKENFKQGDNSSEKTDQNQFENSEKEKSHYNTLDSPNLIINIPEENDGKEEKDLEEDDKLKGDKSLSENKNIPQCSVPEKVAKNLLFFQRPISNINVGRKKPTLGVLLSIRPRLRYNRLGAESLRSRLTQENFITCSVWWLVEKGYLPLNPPCSICGGKSFTLQRDKSYIDGYCWTCDNPKCICKEPIRRPKFFQDFLSITLEEILLLTYHWACQSDIEKILSDVNVSLKNIWNYFQALQKLCGDIVNREILIDGGLENSKLSKVEVSVVQLGTFYILCAYDRKNHYARLETLTIEEASKPSYYINILREWLTKGSVVISKTRIDHSFLPEMYTFAVDSTIKDPTSSAAHILNVTKYLWKNIPSIFGDICCRQMDKDVIQGFLNVLQWRERYAKYTESAFWNIIKHICDPTGDDNYNDLITVNCGDITPENYFDHLNENLRRLWGRNKEKESSGNQADNSYVQEDDPRSKKSSSCSPKRSCVNFVLQNSLFRIQSSIPEIPSGKSNIFALNKLNIKPCLSPDHVESAESLRLKLRQENFISCSVWWLFRKGYLPLRNICASCGGKSFTIHRDKKYIDGFHWICDTQGCHDMKPVKRPAFFEYFLDYTLEELLLLTYHWACQSDLIEISKDVKLNPHKIWRFFRALQKWCGCVINERQRLGQALQSCQGKVEVSIVKLGKFFILGAYDRGNHHTALEIFNEEEACRTVRHIYLLEKWLKKNTILISSNKIDNTLLPDIYTCQSDPAIDDCRSSKVHILNISKYLQTHVTSLFGSYCHNQLEKELIQGFLNELQWRDVHGKFTEIAFWSILNQISELNEYFDQIDVNCGDVIPDHFFVNEKKHLKDRWGPVKILDRGDLDEMKTFNTSENKAAARENPFLSTENHAVSQVESTKESFERPDNLPTAVIKSSQDKTMSVTSGGTSDIIANELLSIRILFDDISNDIRRYGLNAFELEMQLKKEGFLSSPVRWLAVKGYIQSETPCFICKAKCVLQDSHKFNDGCCWTCENKDCGFENIFNRPRFFANFGFHMKHILAVIYHWAVQSNAETIVSELPLNVYEIISIRCKLQELCTSALNKGVFRLGGSNKIVEVAVVKCKNFSVFGALERKKKISNLQAFPHGNAMNINTVSTLLSSWLAPDSCVVVASRSFFCEIERVNFVLADEKITNRNDPNYHVLNINNYMLKHMNSMFGHFKLDRINIDLLQLYLNELMWRERFGRVPQTAFWNIMREISSQDETGVSEETWLTKTEQQTNEFLVHNSPRRVTSKKIPSSNNEKNKDLHVHSKKKKHDLQDDYLTDIKQKSAKFQENISLKDKEEASTSYMQSQDVRETSERTSQGLMDSDNNINNSCNPVDDGMVDSCDSKYLNETSHKSYKKPVLPVEEVAFVNKFKCSECGLLVTVDHFEKQFTCEDCKRSVFSTCCPNSFAEHRRPLLFGKRSYSKNIPNKSHRIIKLNQMWYCPCGFYCSEGNELASHLVKCQKTTCYL